MTTKRKKRRTRAQMGFIALLAIFLFGTPPPLLKAGEEIDQETKIETFDTYWETLANDYPYFEVHGVDWQQAKAEHRERAISAPNHDEFIYELARMFAKLNDAHLSFFAPMAKWRESGRAWTLPQLQIISLREGSVVARWPEGEWPEAPKAMIDHPHPLPIVRSINGAISSTGLNTTLLAGPPGTTAELLLEWPDGSLTTHAVTRPPTSPRAEKFTLPRERWIRAETYGEVGYLALLTFNHETTRESLTVSEMRRVLLDAIKCLRETEKLIIDTRYNGGGQLHLVNVLLNRFLHEKQSIRLREKTLEIKPLEPHYHGEVVVLVNEFSASGGEWFPAFLQHYGRATLVGGKTRGAEGVVTRIKGPDGSTLSVGLNNLLEDEGPTFQGTGVHPDHYIPLTIERLRRDGPEAAVKGTERDRLRKALEVLQVKDSSRVIENQIAEWCEFLVDFWIERYGKASVPEPL